MSEKIFDDVGESDDHKVGSISVDNISEEWAEVGLVGQAEISGREGDIKLHPLDEFVYRTLLPETAKLEEFNSFMIPDDIVPKVKNWMEKFTKLEVWFNMETRGGTIIGFKSKDGSSWSFDKFGLVEWGMPKQDEDALFEAGRVILAKRQAVKMQLRKLYEFQGRLMAEIKWLEDQDADTIDLSKVMDLESGTIKMPSQYLVL